jgi:hypothetical protein
MTLSLGGYKLLYSGNNSTAKYLFNLHVDLVIDIPIACWQLKAVSHFFVLFILILIPQPFLIFPASLLSSFAA